MSGPIAPGGKRRCPCSGPGVGHDLITNSPDVLNNLHTLRRLAEQVKQITDQQRLLLISVRLAEITEAATVAIDHYNATH